MEINIDNLKQLPKNDSIFNEILANQNPDLTTPDVLQEIESQKGESNMEEDICEVNINYMINVFVIN